MNARTRLIIGATIVLIGIGIVSLGFIDQESAVRYVDDIMERPDEHTRGTYTLLGMPQPAMLEGTVGEPQANPERKDALDHVIRWQHDGRVHITTLRIAVTEPGDGSSHWSLQNTTRIPSTGQSLPSTWLNWTIDTPHTVFQIQGFPDSNGIQPTIWGVYEGVLRDPVQPKPSQFEGRVVTSLGGVDLPRGAFVYDIEEYTAGCSSKFLPPDLQEEYKDDPAYQ